MPTRSKEVNPDQVFYSPGGRRGWILLTVLVLVGCFIAVAVDWARTVTTELPPQAASYNTSVNYPREVADAVTKCAKTDGQYGDSGNLEMPVIGTGVFQRVVKVVHDGGTDYAVDPFTGQVYLAAHPARGPRRPLWLRGRGVRHGARAHADPRPPHHASSGAVDAEAAPPSPYMTPACTPRSSTSAARISCISRNSSPRWRTVTRSATTRIPTPSWSI